MSASEKAKRLAAFVKDLKSIEINRKLKELPKSECAILMHRAKRHAKQFNKPYQTNNDLIGTMRELLLMDSIRSIWEKEKQYLIKEYDFTVNTVNTYTTLYKNAVLDLDNSDPKIKQLEEEAREIRSRINNLLNDDQFKAAANFQKESDRLNKKWKNVNHEKERLIRKDAITRLVYAAKYTKFVSPDMKNASKNQQQIRKEKKLEKLLRFDKALFIKTAIKLLESNSKREVLLGLCALTGRRPAELIKTAELIVENKEMITFSGQLKTRGKERKPYQIPVFHDAYEIVKAFNRFRKMIMINEKTGEQIDIKEKSIKKASDDIKDSEYYKLKKKHFRIIFIEEGEGEIQLRSGAATLACEKFRPKNMSDEVFIKMYLGHEGLGSVLNYKGTSPT